MPCLWDCLASPPENRYRVTDEKFLCGRLSAGQPLLFTSWLLVNGREDYATIAKIPGKLSIALSKESFLNCSLPPVLFRCFFWCSFHGCCIGKHVSAQCFCPNFCNVNISLSFILVDMHETCIFGSSQNLTLPSLGTKNR